MPVKPVCWFKHGPYEGDDVKKEVVFDDPCDDTNFSALIFADGELNTTIMSDSEVVMKFLETGEWAIAKHVDDEAMSDEWNKEHSWMVTRQIKPFCSPSGTRQWFGETAILAFRAAVWDLAHHE